FWAGLAGTLMPPVAVADLPASLLARFAGPPDEQLLSLLRALWRHSASAAPASPLPSGACISRRGCPSRNACGRDYRARIRKRNRDASMSPSKDPSVHERWAHLRFSVVGQLLAAPPPKGLLRAELERLASRTWRHPITGEPVRFALSTIERWLHRARRERRDPVAVLRRKVRADAGTQQLRLPIRHLHRAQYAAHPSWSVKLHYLHLRALAEVGGPLRPGPPVPGLRP